MKNEPKNKTATITREEKLAGGVILEVSLVISGIIVFAVFFIAGFSVELGDDALSVKAKLAPGVTVAYADIESVETESDVPAGFRTNGYGTPWLKMGNFENDVFGKYKRYTYPSCQTVIVLKTASGQYVVINESTEQQTAALYYNIAERVK